MENNYKKQIIAGYQTHKQIKQLIPVYDTDESPVPVREIHTGLEAGTGDFNVSGLQMIIGADCSYEDYLTLLNYAAKNPLKKEVFEKVRQQLESEA